MTMPFEKVFEYKDIVDATILHDRNPQNFKPANALFRKSVVQRLLTAKKLPLTWKLTKESDMKFMNILSEFYLSLCCRCTDRPVIMGKVQHFINQHMDWVNSKNWIAVFEEDTVVSTGKTPNTIEKVFEYKELVN